MMNKVENAIIFAAGMGSRMTPLTQYLPKPLIPVRGRAMIERNIRFLKESGINKIYVVVGYLRKQFKYLEDKYGVKFIRNRSYKEYNNISSLEVSLDKWENTLYVEGDLYLTKNIFPDVIDMIEKEDSPIAFSQECLQHKKEWVYNVDRNGFVKDHKPKQDACSLNIWSGILYLNKKVCDEMKEKFADYYKNIKNRQDYFETFLWTLDTKFRHVKIPDTPIYELDNFNDLLEIDESYASHSSTLLFTPGPVNNYPEVSSILANTVLHHRSPLFKMYLRNATKTMKEFFKTKTGMPLFITSSATGAMEAIVVNLVSPEDKILLIEAGDFGKRFQEMITRLCGSKNNLDILSYEDGITYDANEVEEKIKKNKYTSVFITHHETSTGVLHDVEKIGKMIKKHSPTTLYITDTVSSIIHEEFKFDEWNVDAAISTSGKAFCVMPGLSCVCLSPRAIEVVRKNKNFKFYFDLNKYIDFYNEQQSTPFTPASSILIAMNASMGIIKNETVEAIREARRSIYLYIREELRDLGFKDVVHDAHITNGLLVMQVPNGYDAEILRNIIDYKEHIYFELGRKDRRKTQVRIGLPNVIDMPKAKLLVRAIKRHLPDSKIRDK